MRVYLYLLVNGLDILAGVVLAKNIDSAKDYLKKEFPYYDSKNLTDITLDLISWIPQLPKVTYD